MKKLFQFFIPIAAVLSLTVSPLFAAPEPAAAAPPTTVVYNMYATDGYWPLADDGTPDGLGPLYSYGFIGGRAGVPFSYIDQSGALVTVPAGPPAPVAGPIQGTAGDAVPGEEADLAGNAQFPAPLIYCKVGDVVQINLKNLGVTNPDAPNDPHTIHLHAIDVDAANDGVPETSVATIPANSVEDPGAGNVVVYMFTAKYPGTYMYHCHQEADIHVTMGMYGALVVYEPGDPAALTGPGKGMGGKLFNYKYDKDYVILLSDTDTNIHEAEGGTLGADFNMVDYKPQYWFINGLSFPQTIHAGFGTPVNPFTYPEWEQAHPGYDPFPTGSVGLKQKVLLRIINLGFQTQPMHMHGFHFDVIGSDQRGIQHPYQKNTLTVGSGETYEVIVDFGTLATASSVYQAGTYTRYDPATGNSPQLNGLVNFPAIPDPFIEGFAYVGGPVVGPPVPPVQGPGGLPPVLPPTLGQYFPFHNHDDYKATNNGVYPGGQFTMIMPLP